MSDFDKLCKEFENLDILTYGAILADKSLDILPKLEAITFDGFTGAEIYGQFILSAVAADGKLTEEEYVLIYPMLHAFFGEEINYEDCKKVIRSLNDLKQVSDEMVDVLGVLDESLKNDIILVCLLICAVDGKVGIKEKAWIKKLID